ncbi:HEAT repeat domain-containing protein, partial [Candidatus Sumerlaeota bacterium]|nr:HEAT repeat domain-containing protein [Candidatus Sumerlaeota bacterium]
RLLVYDPNDQKNKLAVVMVLAELKSESTVEPLTQALNDADYHVKVKAIDALAEMIEASPEWIEHLASIIKTEPPSSVKVRRAAALALQTIGTKESFQALDQVSRQCQFDEGLNKILAAMTEKFRGGQMEGRKQKIQEEKKKKAQERQVEESKFRLEPKMIGMFAMLIAFLGGLGFAIMLWAKSMGPQVPFKPEDIKPPPATIVKSKGQIKDFANKFNKLNK